MIEARAFVEAAAALGIRWYAGVPCSFLTPFINYTLGAPETRYIMCANEGDAVALACGLELGGAGPAVAMMQNSGLGNAVNPLTSLAHTFRIPLLLITTLRGDPDLGDEPQHRLMGRITGPLLSLMEIPWEQFPREAQALAPALQRVQAWFSSERRPYGLVMRKGSVAPHPLAGTPPPRRAPGAVVDLRRGARPPTRATVLGRLLERTDPASSVVVATTGYTGRELFALEDRPNHLYMVGSMGCALMLGLGLALARPDRTVIVVDGDGAALMRMGNFATVGAYGPANLIHVLLDNAAHESTGGQFTVSPGVAFAEVARSCGYAWSGEGDDVAALDAALQAQAEGPRFLHLHTTRGVMDDLPRPTLAPEQVATRLRGHLRAPSRQESSS